jgi:hypothetical protein
MTDHLLPHLHHLHPTFWEAEYCQVSGRRLILVGMCPCAIRLACESILEQNLVVVVVVAAAAVAAVTETKHLLVLQERVFYDETSPCDEAHQ